jgi:hypothetical protein
VSSFSRVLSTRSSRIEIRTSAFFSRGKRACGVAFGPDVAHSEFMSERSGLASHFMLDNKPTVVIVAGPTASGKTRVGMLLAEMFNGEIVSADSIQIYRHMDVGSAKPTIEERSRVIHHMIDVREPDERFSVGDYGI